MLITPTPEQELFQDMTVRLLRERMPIARLRQLREDPAGFEKAVWAEGAALGWTSLLVSEADGGGTLSGRGLVDLALVAYEFGRHAAAGPLLDTNLVASALTRCDGDAHKAALRTLIEGSEVASFCPGTPLAGNARQPGVRIVRDGDALVIDGMARPCGGAGAAAWLLVTGQADVGAVQVLVPAETPGVEIRKLSSLDVTRRFGEVRFTNVRLPRTALLGEWANAESAVTRQVLIAGVLLAAEAAGAMQSAFEMTLAYAFDRYSFGRPLSSYQALKHRFADLKSWLEAAQAIATSAAFAAADETGDARDLVSAAQAFIGDYGSELAQDCVQLHGGIGVTYEHDLHFFMRRIALNRTLFGTPSHHRQRLAAYAAENLEAA